MEHRWCKRRRLRLEVELTSPCGTACVAHTRDISMDGMFVDVQADTLSNPKLVHVKLPAAAGVPRLEALVVHTCEQGVGLVFEAVDNQDRRLLARYLSESGRGSGQT